MKKLTYEDEVVPRLGCTALLATERIDVVFERQSLAGREAGPCVVLGLESRRRERKLDRSFGHGAAGRSVHAQRCPARLWGSESVSESTGRSKKTEQRTETRASATATLTV